MGWFYEPMDQADKSHKMADESVTATKTDWYDRFNWSATQFCLSFH